MTYITARAIVAGGIVIFGSSCCRSSRRRNCRSAIVIGAMEHLSPEHLSLEQYSAEQMWSEQIAIVAGAYVRSPNKTPIGF